MTFAYTFSNDQSLHPEFQATVLPNVHTAKKLKLLSWNIKMFPNPYGWFHNSLSRTKNISKLLQEFEQYDIILFQEAFSIQFCRIIYKSLHSMYPYQILPKEQGVVKQNSGLWAISRVPIKLKDEIYFTQTRAWDKLASKGAKLYSITINKQEFQIINTHMQSDYNQNYSDIRINQYTEINDKLVQPHSKTGIPLILCGDLNISKQTKLQKMLEKLNLENGPLSGKMKFSTLGNYNELLDYILIHSENFQYKLVERRIHDFSTKTFDQSTNFSDHFPIEAKFIW